MRAYEIPEAKDGVMGAIRSRCRWLDKVVGTLEGMLEFGQRHVSIEEEDCSAKMVECHDAEVRASRWVLVDANSDRGVLAFEVEP